MLRQLGRNLQLQRRDRTSRLLEDPLKLRDYSFVKSFHGFCYPKNRKCFIDCSVFLYGAFNGH